MDGRRELCTRAEPPWRRCLALAALTLLAACGDDAPSSATVLEPSFGDACAYEHCSEHGQCMAAPGGGPMCLCNVGYGGSKCTHCESGFHLDAKGRCAPDRSCAEQDTDPCGAHGSCDDSDGVIMCGCDPGYEGPRCTLCSSGFGRGDFGECLMLVLDGTGGSTAPPPAIEPPAMQPGTAEPPPAPALCTTASCNGNGACDGETGRIVCTCEAAYSGARCASCAANYRRDSHDACVPFDKCTAGACGDHGRCDDATGLIACTCDPGHAGDTCGECAPGFHASGMDCVLDQECLPSSCAGQGTCAVSAGSVSCTCNAAYSGAHCEHCATGYHRNLADDTCAVDEVCATGDCGDHGSCDDSTGVVTCACDDGYEPREDCRTCAPGFHDTGDGSCALDEACQPGACSTHSVCDESSGVVECSCDPGYQGTTCDACASGYYRDHASGACVLFDCHTNPISGAGLMTFEDVLWFPGYTNNCGTKADVNTDDVRLTSISGDGDVWSCAASDIYAMSTRHVLLEAGATGPAELTFSGPISSLAFDYAAKSNLELELLGDGAVISTLGAARKSHASLSFTFDAPITVFALRSTSEFTNEIALDNIAYTPPACP
jgi:hypothetical protein